MVTLRKIGKMTKTKEELLEKIAEHLDGIEVALQTIAKKGIFVEVKR